LPAPIRQLQAKPDPLQNRQEVNGQVNAEGAKMKKIISAFLLIILVAFYHPAPAQNLLSGEARTYYNQAVRAQNEGDFDTAYTLYQKALLLNSTYQEAVINNLGVMFVYRGDWDKAKASFSEALSANPDYKPALFNLGLLYYMRGDEKEALRYWTKYFEVGELGFRSFIVEQEKEEEKPAKGTRK
jgi:tetratricopeptide (TPR) repeat protein